MNDTESKIDREKTIDAIISLSHVFRRTYLNLLTLETLHDLEESLLEANKDIVKK